MAMTDFTLSCLLRQHETAWKLANHGLKDLTTDECLWRPCIRGPHVQQRRDGTWRADWPTYEGYDIGPPSIAWLTWHMGYWWSMVLDHSFGDATLSREHISWPGDAANVRTWLGDLQARWSRELTRIDNEEVARTERTRWPFRERPFADVVAWVNIELTKNAAEIGYARFLYASNRGQAGE